ncbi:putative deacetylase LmbE-like domain-containing protein [Microdochium trichocladiopsis]|uniref:N-acetylglucosaminylphosphatidylinositol deacetylase n=1 Tax=Microdochium trichocladiopsis TaxID=1682393 RepID=A0A9P9BWF7_9PEZI|nr:putative deacetylase LmbE-like domain-containing protein [Microdochium trichocladiopsis]KAH7041353.1 putative deacetylase LmbE-like domain-containing protein [Microdochium trichocladiopsis]
MLVVVLLSVLTVGLPLLYTYIATSYVKSVFPVLRNKRICLLIAHPDDEAMFFAPTVLALTRPETGNHVKILCLSTGDADGLGETRKKELVKSGLLLGLRDESDVFVIDDPNNFPDSMTTTWNADAIATLLQSIFVPSLSSDSPSTETTATVDVILTFDKGGVSSHPNHISLYHGARAFVASLTAGHQSAGSSSGTTASPVDVYTLTSVPMLRKYASFLDIFYTLASAASPRTDKDGKPRTLISASSLWSSGNSRIGSSEAHAADPPSYGTARNAMTQAHKSQMVWFRWGWIGLSRYMVVNDLKLETIARR